MSFSGNVSSMSLDEVFSFLAGNGLTGELTVQTGDEVRQRLFFKEGRLFFAQSARRGTYSLGKILRHTGILSREGLAKYLDELQDTREKLEQEEESEEVKQARAMQYTEEIHDLFLWKNTRFEFKPGPWPTRIEADQEAGRGLQIDTTSLLMDVARRADERRRIREFIPSTRLILSTSPGSEAVVVAALGAVGVDCAASPFDGTLDLDELLDRWGIPHHVALAALTDLLEAAHLVPVPPDETRRRIRELLQGEDLLPAARLLGHWVELGHREDERFALDLEQEFVTSPAFTQGPEEVSNLRLDGPRLFTLLRVLIRLKNPFTLTLHHRGWEKQVAALPGQIYMRNERRKSSPTPTLAEYLVKLGHLTRVQEAEREKQEEPPALDTLVDSDQLQEARVSKLIDELAEVVFWGRTEAEIRNRSSGGPESGDFLDVALGKPERKRLHRGLDDWAEVFDAVPGENCLFVPGDAAARNDPAGRFFKRFDITKNVGELRDKAQATSLEFAQFVFQGIQRGYLRPPNREELQAALQEAANSGNDVMSYRLALGGAALGYTDLDATPAQTATVLPAPFPALEGDLDGVGLAAVLQALRRHRRTGTLTVRADRLEEKLFFFRGDAFILRIEDAEADEFVAFFLGSEGEESVSELGSGLSSRGLTDESELTEAEVSELKNQFLDVLFWEGSTFGFYQSSLPDEFFNPEQGVSKIALHTDRFLMEAIQNMNEWEELCEVIGGNRSVFQFSTAAGKLEAIRDRGHPEILTLIDGRLCLNDLVRISGQPRLEVGRTVAPLVTEGSLAIVGHKKTTRLYNKDAIPDPIPD